LTALGGPIWKAAFGKPADQIQKSMEKDDECELGNVEITLKWGIAHSLFFL